MNLNSSSISFYTYDINGKTLEEKTPLTASIRAIGQDGIVGSANAIHKYIYLTNKDLRTDQAIEEVIEKTGDMILTNFILEVKRDGHFTLKSGLGGSN